jgi:hypothetical protein
MEAYSDSDTSSESEFGSDQGYIAGSNCDDEEPSENLEPELTETVHDEFEND